MKVLKKISVASMVISILCLFLFPAQPAEIIPINGWKPDVKKNRVRLDKAPEKKSLFLISRKTQSLPVNESGWRSHGFSRIAWIPPDFVMVMVKNPRKSYEFLKSVQDAVPLKPEWKIDRSLARISPDAVSSYIYLVVHSVGFTDKIFFTINEAGGNIQSQSKTPGKYRAGVRVSPEKLDHFLKRISKNSSVYSIEPGYGARLLNNNAAAITQTGSTSSLRPIWDHGIRGENQVIAVCDTGLDFDSCYFAEDDGTSPPLVYGTGTGCPDASRRKVLIYDLLYSPDFDAEPGDFDNQGHGTGVAGNALGSRLGNPWGENVWNGMAPAAKLIVQDAGFSLNNCADLPALGCPVVDLTPFLNQVFDQGTHFMNYSWGDRENYSPKNIYTGPTADIDDATWRNPGFLIFCAAGNSGSQGFGSALSPGTGKNLVSVGATESPTFSGDYEELTYFSSLGYASDGRIKPDLTAPGQTATSSSDKNIDTDNCNISSMQGTSMASPVTAGCAALVRQYLREGWINGSVDPEDAVTTPSAALIKAILLNGAEHMTGVSVKPPNRYEGWGRVNLNRSLYFDGDDRKVIFVDDTDYFTTDTASPFTLEFDAGGNTFAEEIRVTLVWSDYPADPAATYSLVNDLDLVVEDETSTTTVYYGNNIDNGSGGSGYSLNGGTPDSVNNVEMVILPPDAEGLFLVRVEASNLVETPQGFALVIGGDVVRSYESGVKRWKAYPR